MKKWYWIVVVILIAGLSYAGEQTVKSMYFSKGQVFNPDEKVVILQNATASADQKTWTISTTNYIILDYTISQGNSYYATIICGGELK